MKKINVFSMIIFMIVASLISAQNTKIIDQYVKVNDKHFLILKDKSILEILPIASRGKNLTEWFSCEPVPTIDEKFFIDLNEFEFPKSIEIFEKKNEFDEMMDLFNEKSCENIEKATHLIHLQKDDFDKWLLAQVFDVPSLIHFLDKTREKDSEKVYNDAYNYGYDKGNENGYKTGFDKAKKDGSALANQKYNEGHKVGFEKGKTEGYKTGFDKAKKDGSALANQKYTEGHKIGLDKGKTEGYKTGFDKAKKDGAALAGQKYTEGHKVGLDKGKTEGYKTGFDKAKKDGAALAGQKYTEGHKVGFDKGKTEGYKAGFTNAEKKLKITS